MNVPMIYFHRYLRLTPIVAVVIAISLTLFKKVNSFQIHFFRQNFNNSIF